VSKKKTKEKNQVIEIHIYIHLEPVGAGSPTTTPQTIPYPPYPVYPSPKERRVNDSNTRIFKRTSRQTI